MDAVGAGRIILGLETILPLLFYVGAAGDCTVSVSQPAVLEADFAEGAVTVPCFFSTAGCQPEPPTKLWFRLGAQKPETLCVNGQCSSKSNKFTVTEDLARNQTSLTNPKVSARNRRGSWWLSCPCSPSTLLVYLWSSWFSSSQNRRLQEKKKQTIHKRRKALGVFFRKLLKNYIVRDMWEQANNLRRTPLTKTEEDGTAVKDSNSVFIVN